VSDVGYVQVRGHLGKQIDLMPNFLLVGFDIVLPASIAGHIQASGIRQEDPRSFQLLVTEALHDSPDAGAGSHQVVPRPKLKVSKRCI